MLSNLKTNKIHASNHHIHVDCNVKIDCVADNATISIGHDGRIFSYDSNTMVTSTICSVGWDSYDASVVCRQLGIGSFGRAFTVSRDYNYQRSMYNLQCSGSESHLSDCSHDESDFYGQCYYMNDAAVECRNSSKYFYALCVQKIYPSTYIC